MDRREALKKLGLSFGFFVGTPAALSMLQGCTTSDPKASWSTMFFNDEQAILLSKVSDIILPATEGAPSASEVNVPQFIDQYMAEVVNSDEQEVTKNYFSKYTAKLKKDADKTDVSELGADEIEPSIANSLDKTPNEEEQIHQEINTYVQAQQNGEKVELIDKVASYALLTNIRQLTIWSYKTSEKVGKEILAYDPVPGRQQGCISVEEATGGRAWSL